MDVFNAVLPVITLILGAGLTQLQSNVGSSRSARSEARQELAKLWKRVWDKGRDESWTDLQAYQGSLRGYLIGARVPRDKIDVLMKAMTECWYKIHDTGDPEVGMAAETNSYDALEAAAESVWASLDDALGVRRRGRRQSPPS